VAPQTLADHVPTVGAVERGSRRQALINSAGNDFLVLDSPWHYLLPKAGEILFAEMQDPRCHISRF
jgi:hypothetical protein